jgi:hypothetical protein
LPAYLGAYLLIYAANASTLRWLTGDGIDPILAQLALMPAVVLASWLLIGRVMGHRDASFDAPPAPAAASQRRPVAARRGTVLLTICLCILIPLILAALFGRIMGYDLRRDEFMFVPPAALLGDYTLYTDLFYNHVPYAAWLFRGAHVVLPDLGLLTTARMVVFAGWLALLGSAAWLGWHLGRSLPLALFCAMSLLSAEVLLGQTGMAATNNLLPLPFLLLGLGLIAMALTGGRLAFMPLFIAGVLLSVAAGLKASAGAVIPVVALSCLLLPHALTLAERLRYMVVPVAAGGIVGALPLLWLARTRTALFFDHILGYHTGPHVAYWQANAASEPDLAMSIGAKVQLAQSVWLAGAPLLALFVIVLLIGMRLTQPVVPMHPPARGTASALVLVAAASLALAMTAFVPTPGFPQYYAMALVGLPLMAALAFRALPPQAAVQARAVLWAGLILMAVLAAPRLALGLSDLRQPERLTPARLQQGAAELRSALAGRASGPVATLSPLYVLEAGLPIYPELSAGPFAYRVAPYLSAELRAQYAMAGADDLEALFAATPPAAILTGFDAVLEQPLSAYAAQHGYLKAPLDAVSDRYGQGALWLPPMPDTHPKTGDDR